MAGRRAAVGVSLLLVPAAALAGCGGERSFSAEEIVAELNSRGAGLELGAPLTSTRPDTELRAIEVADPLAGGDGSAGPSHGGGSVAVLESPEAGLAEYARCEQAASLVCYRAANVVLLLEDELSPEARDRLAASLRALAEE